MNDDFQVVAAYTIPHEILDRFKPMSNSGGSWDPDGRLWLTGPRPTLWTIKRSTKQVLELSVPYRQIADPPANDWHTNGPGHFSNS
jgi:hypothetical protein